MMNAVSDDKIDDEGLHITRENQPEVMDVDTIIICAGQNPLRQLYDDLQAKGVTSHLIGGAYEAAELDAKRAIDQGSRLASQL